MKFAKKQIWITVSIFIVILLLSILKLKSMYGHVLQRIDKLTASVVSIEETIVPFEEPIPSENSGNAELPKTITDIVNEEIQQQEEVDQWLKNELNTGSYTLDDPFVVLNPYGRSPLSALVLFTTETPERIELNLLNEGALAGDDIFVDFGSFETEHMIPVYGLYPDTDNQVLIKSYDESGNEEAHIVSIKTDKLPPDLENIVFIADCEQPEKYEKGFNFSVSGLNQDGFRKAFDSLGNIRWFLNQPYFVGTLRFSNDGSILLSNIMDGQEVIYEMDFLGKIRAAYLDDLFTHHDIHMTDHGTMIMTKDSHIPGGTIEDLLKEIDINTGEVLHVLDYRYLLPKTRKVGDFYSDTDWLHMNSVVEYQGDVIVSSNCQSTVMRNDWDGNIKWMLANPTDWLPQWRKYLLKPIGKNFEYPYNQHSVDILPDLDNNPDTVDIILFDNGLSRNTMEKRSDAPYSRLVHYRIDEKNMTVEQIRQFGKEYPEMYSRFRGDMDILENGNWYGTFNQEAERNGTYTIKDTVYVEVDDNNQIVWECYAANGLAADTYQDHGAERLDMYYDPQYADLNFKVKVLDISGSEVTAK